MTMRVSVPLPVMVMPMFVPVAMRMMIVPVRAAQNPRAAQIDQQADCRDCHGLLIMDLRRAEQALHRPEYHQRGHAQQEYRAGKRRQHQPLQRGRHV